MTIAVTGATGNLGQLAITALKARVPASEILALARDPAKAQSLGVAARAFDYDKPENLAAALAGVDKLLLVSGNELGKRTAQHSAVIAAAKATGVKLIAYTSLLRADTSPISLGVEHRETEAALKASGVAYVILRNGWYVENYMGAIPGALASGAYIGSAGDGKISAASRADYAEAAAVVLTSEGHANKTYELAGDMAFTLTDLAAELSRQSGKTIPYKDLPQAEYAKILASFGLPPIWADGLAAWSFDTTKGALFDDGHQLSKLIGRPTTTLREAISVALKA
jgi:NAD(P)H dehydrogenase (quinone)